jgi:hypothetical protein|tara:strand:+ start:495 stop:701 length:207 start_codon:yes stop_codon:yes gene_type:complete
MKTIVKDNTISVVSDNIRVTIDEDEERVFIWVNEKRRTEDGNYDSTEEVITNNLSIPKARELTLKIID